jgi:hypothetical protein
MRRPEDAKVLERADFPSCVIEDFLTSLPDPMDLDHLDPNVVARCGLTPEHLMDMLGGSP